MVGKTGVQGDLLPPRDGWSLCSNKCSVGSPPTGRIRRNLKELQLRQKGGARTHSTVGRWQERGTSSGNVDFVSKKIKYLLQKDAETCAERGGGAVRPSLIGCDGCSAEAAGVSDCILGTRPQSADEAGRLVSAIGQLGRRLATVI